MYRCPGASSATQHPVHPRETNHGAARRPTGRAGSGSRPDPTHHASPPVPASTSTGEHASRSGSCKDASAIVCATEGAHTPPKHTDHERLVVPGADNAEFLEAVADKTVRQRQPRQQGSHPAEKIQLHPTAVVDAVPVPPGFSEVDPHFRNTVLGQSFKCRVQTRRCLQDQWSKKEKKKLGIAPHESCRTTS